MTSALRNKLSVLVQRRSRLERRLSKRVVPIHRPLCQVCPTSQEESADGVVQDLSLKGVALLVEREFPLGTVLHVQLVNVSHTFSLALEMKVVRCSRNAANQFLVAGPFDRPLAHEEMVPFLL